MIRLLIIVITIILFVIGILSTIRAIRIARRRGGITDEGEFKMNNTYNYRMYAADSPIYKRALSSLTDQITTSEKRNMYVFWSAFLNNPNRQTALGFRDRMETLIFLFPGGEDIGNTDPITLNNGKKTTDPAVVLMDILDRIYHVIGQHADTNNPQKRAEFEIECNSYFRQAYDILGSDTEYIVDKCSFDSTLSGRNKIGNSDVSWNDYIRMIDPSKVYALDRKVKEQFWGEFSADPSFDILSNLTLLTMVQCYYTIAELAKAFNGDGTIKLLDGSEDDEDIIEVFHNVRKEIRSFTRVFTGNPQISYMFFETEDVKDGSCFKTCATTGYGYWECLKEDICEQKVRQENYMDIRAGDANWQRYTKYKDDMVPLRGLTYLYKSMEDGCNDCGIDKGKMFCDPVCNDKLCDWVQHMGCSHDMMTEYMNLEPRERRPYISQINSRISFVIDDMAKNMVDVLWSVIRTCFAYDRVAKKAFDKGSSPNKIVRDIIKKLNKADNTPIQYKSFQKEFNPLF